MLYAFITFPFGDTATVIYLFERPMTYRTTFPILISIYAHINIHIHIIIKNPISIYHIASSMWGGPLIISFIATSDNRYNNKDYR